MKMSKTKTGYSYPPPKAKGAAPVGTAAAGAAAGIAEGVAGIVNPNPVLAGADAVVPAIT